METFEPHRHGPIEDGEIRTLGLWDLYIALSKGSLKRDPNLCVRISRMEFSYSIPESSSRTRDRDVEKILQTRIPPGVTT